MSSSAVANLVSCIIVVIGLIAVQKFGKISLDPNKKGSIFRSEIFASGVIFCAFSVKTLRNLLKSCAFPPPTLAYFYFANL